MNRKHYLFGYLFINRERDQQLAMEDKKKLYPYCTDVFRRIEGG
eukprot:SAG31_NODE_1098_length_9919_cov_2.877495_6_plen_44_part_00